MTWLSWRQFRAQGAVVGAVLAVVAVIVVFTGVDLAHDYSACRAAADCGTVQLSSIDNDLQITLSALMLVVPALVGIFWGAPLIARELETGTNRLGWTQSITRTRWLAARLAVFGLGSVVVAGLLSLLITWWNSPLDAVQGNRFGPAIFGLRGIVPIAYAAFAFALGATLGTLIRRTLPAMATTLVSYLAVRLAFTTWVRPLLLSPLHTNVSLRGANSIGISVGPSGAAQVVVQNTTIPNDWVYSASVVDQHGRAMPSDFLSRTCPGVVPRLGSGPLGVGKQRAAVPAPDQATFTSCMTKVAAKYHELVTYQPGSRFWAFQGLESAIFIALALALCTGCLWWIRHRLA